VQVFQMFHELILWLALVILKSWSCLGLHRLN
jgi:flagellar biogenesis protein FliO